MANPLLDEQLSKACRMPHATCPSAFMAARKNTRNASLSSCRVPNDSAADLTAQTQVNNSRVEHLVNFKCLLAQFTISHMAKGKVHKDATEPEPESSPEPNIHSAYVERRRNYNFIIITKGECLITKFYEATDRTQVILFYPSPPSFLILLLLLSFRNEYKL